jgi:isoleucyl-tRNA synthetase
MFEFHQSESIAEREERVLSAWKGQGIFEKSLQIRETGPQFTFYDGPPFATGLPHYGHLLAGTIKDVVPRYKTMKGYRVPRRFGWDCHGLPVENEIEKSRELSGASAIEAFGISAFNEECRSIVLRYTEEWKHTVERMGRWVAFDETYRTMDLSFMESVWWVFSELYKQGLVYEGFKVMPFSTKLGTPLSNFEANLNYKEVDDPSLTVKFELRDEPGVFLLVWTTTPWTLPSNLAVMANPQLTYVKIKELSSGAHFILAQTRLPHYFKDKESYEVLSTFPGSSLNGKFYLPLFPYYAAREEQAFRMILEEGIASDEGTGLVHAAPAFGEVDFYACAREGIEPVNPVDHNGKFTSEIKEYAGLFVKDADKEIIRRLKGEGKVFLHTQVRHRYPFCWRSDTPLIYKAVRTWFVAVEKIKEKMLSANEKIHWVPEHIQTGRFGKWLENARDWAISRNRYWGTPIPLWRSDDGEILVISSVRELEEKTGQKIEDIHRHFIDTLVIEERGKLFRRITEVFDCWFESGSMPYAQQHYPFEGKEKFASSFPADFIAEGLDQTRGWFYTLTVLASALFDQPAFKNVIVNGIILAEDGQKMSKRLKNYPEPLTVVNRYGADAVRLYLLNSSAVYGEDLRFSERGVEQVLRQALIPLWNSFVFLSTYATIYDWEPQGTLDGQPQAEIDRWILSQLQKLIGEVTERIDAYELHRAVEPLTGFIEQLTNWYIRRSRGRFWADEASPDREEAFETLYRVLVTFVKVAAPFVPFISEAVYLQLRRPSDPESVHLCDFPVYNNALRCPELEEEMRYAQEVVSLGHALRKEHKLKVRQPLASAYLISSDEGILAALRAKEALIREELNVREICFESQEQKFVSIGAKPHFRVLGKKVGGQMQAVQAAISALPQASLKALMEGGTTEIFLEGSPLTLTPEDVEVKRVVKEGLVAATSAGVTIALNTTLNESLLIEGLAREVINKINTMRKEAGFLVIDRIEVCLEPTARLEEAFRAHGDHIRHETLTTKVTFCCKEGEELDLNGEKTRLSLALAPGEL